jgi:DNA-binding protein Fis
MWRKREIMTLPDERYRSIRITETLLTDLCSSKATPGVPRVIRQRAAQCLRHYPGHYDLTQLESAAPHVVQQQMEPLHRMVMQYSNEDLRELAADDHEGSTLD